VSQRSEDKWDNGKIGRNVMIDGSIKLKMRRKVPLQGLELEFYQQKERAARDKEAALARNQRMLEADEDDSDSDSDSDADEEDEVRQTLSGEAMDTGAETDCAKNDGSGGKRGRGDKGLDNTDWLDGDEGLTKQLLSFDIYLKGNVSRSTFFFKNAGQTQCFRMFPYVEKKRRVDDYGETIDVGMWLRKVKALEEEAASEDVKDYRRRTLAEEDAKVSVWGLLARMLFFMGNRRTSFHFSNKARP
jgi:cleavage and polyadenylation specificity factor subunit 2